MISQLSAMKLKQKCSGYVHDRKIDMSGFSSY